MSFILRNWWKLAVALIAAGAVLFLAGWSMGCQIVTIVFPDWWCGSLLSHE